LRHGHQSRSEKLVLTHIVQANIDEEATRVAVARCFPGEVIVGHDGLVVTPDSVSSAVPAGAAATLRTYSVVDTGQDQCFDDREHIADPLKGAEYYGQDAQYQGVIPRYKDHQNGTITDLNTGLMWQKGFDQERKQSFLEASSNAAACRTGGHSDWRLPSIKELYSLMDFRGLDPSGPETAEIILRPFIDTNYFNFVYGDSEQGVRLIDAQYWSATAYAGSTMNGKATVFGVNVADGRVKGYPRDTGRNGKPFRAFVRYVRGNPKYGRNDFHDNNNGTVSDRATGLMWQKGDGGKPMDWKQALTYAEGLELAGHQDWRLPNAKELQSLVDYRRAPDAGNPSFQGPAIDPIFTLTESESYFWTGTTHIRGQPGDAGASAVYICFGRALGYMVTPDHAGKILINVHGAGAQRSDPKSGDPAGFPQGRGPQGDDIRIFNFVRCVRGGEVTKIKTQFADHVAEENKYPGQRDAGKTSGNARSGKRFTTRLDRNDDGKVSLEEFDGPANHFGRLDRNHDGYLDEDEAPQGRPTPSGN
jgi:hypothetical protein